MSQPISLFSGYSQQENRVTNYCLLTLKLLYAHNPVLLASVLREMLGEDVGDRVGVRFEQQTKDGASIPDGAIVQEALTIRIETKLSESYSADQFRRHLESLSNHSGLRVLILLCKSNDNESLLVNEVRSLAEGTGVQAAAVNFTEFLSYVRHEDLPIALSETIEEFGEFLASQDLLETWQEVLDVVNCAKWPEIQIEDGIYMCPLQSGAYSHRRSRFFGVYRAKCVSHIAEIEGMLEFESPDTGQVVWKNVSRESNQEMILRARSLIEKWGWDYPVRAFLLGDRFKTDFRKISKGGMLSSKRYFSVKKFDSGSSELLAKSLDGRSWE